MNKNIFFKKYVVLVLSFLFIGISIPPSTSRLTLITQHKDLDTVTTTSGFIAAWGDDYFGQCDVPSPNTDFIAIAAGYSHSLGLKVDGSIVAWGSNNFGQCDIPSPNTDFIAIATEREHNLGLKADGSIVAWGLNDYGQCDVPSPNTDFIAIAAGHDHSLGLKANGSIIAWGRIDFGQCNIPSPNTDFIAIAAGYVHSLGLKANGSIVAWGDNRYDQCNVPAPNSDFIAIAADGYYSLGLKVNGSIVAWGSNHYGQCNVPTPNSDFIAIAAGFYHSLGLKADGWIVAWGYNLSGVCDVPSPNTDFIAISAGYSHNLGLKTSSLNNIYDIYVDAAAAPSWYDHTHVRTIQEGINNATEGDTVFVYNGTYHERVNINKQIQLIGENKSATIIDGSNIDNVITVSSVHVTISGFTIQNSGNWGSGIYVHADYTNITNVTIAGSNHLGVEIDQASNTSIATSTIKNAGYAGVYLKSEAYYTNILGNTFLFDNSAIIIYNGSYTTISGNTISQCGWGIDLWPCDHVQIIGNSIYNNDAYGIQIAESSFITITGNQIYNNEQGIDIYGSADTITISGNTIRNHPSGGIALEGLSNPHFSNCVITQNTIEHNGYGLLLAYVTGSTVTNNTFTDNSLTIYCMKPEDANTHTIEGNTVNGKPIRYYKDMQGVIVPQYTGEVIVANCNNVSIQNLAIHNIETGIELLYCTGATLTGNSISTSGMPILGGLIIQNSTGVNVENNQITDGMALAGSQGCTISLNNFIVTQEYGWCVYLLGSSYSEVSQNTFTSSISNQGFGIGLEQASYNQITKNNVENLGEGIALIDQSNNNTFSENILTNNNLGFDIIVPVKEKEPTRILSLSSFLYGNDKTGPTQYPCYNNTIYHNNFVNNIQSASDGSTNTWDNGYTSGGNYWSDYNGIDSDGDGIGDTPYNISGGNNQDRYPLMKPWAPKPSADIYVEASAVPSWYDHTHVRTIQEGINNASAGDTVFVFNGTYFENISIDKTLNLVGENKETTVIDAGGNSINCISIYANFVNISGFTIKNCSAGFIFYSVEHCICDNNVVYNTSEGFHLDNANYNTIANNLVYSNENAGENSGLALFSSHHNTIFNNTITNYETNPGQGIYLFNSSYNVIDHNTIFALFYMQMGILLGSSSNHNILSRNNVSSCVDGITIYNTCSNNTINDCLFENDLESGVGIGSDCPNNNIISCSFHNNYLAGIILYLNTNTQINTCSFFNCSIDIRGSRVEHFNTHEISNCVVNGKPLYYIKNQSGVSIPLDAGEVILANCSNVQISNRIFENVTAGVQLCFSDNITITDCIIRNYSIFGIYLYHSKNNIISNCEIFDSSSFSSLVFGSGIYLEDDSNNNIIKNCVLHNNSWFGIYTGNGPFGIDSDNTTISNCTLYNNSWGYYDNYQITSRFNTIGSQTTRGTDKPAAILISGNYNKIIDGCHVYNNSCSGVMVIRSSYNLISGNSIEKNADDGIYMLDGSNNTIIQNTFKQNNKGINILSEYYSVRDNNVYHNNFINNSLKAYDEGTDNWSNDTIKEGNYWSDYTGIDANGDGIGDTPYNISGGSNKDRYPLMKPYINYPPNTPSKPTGPIQGMINTPYTYSTSATAPNGNQLFYLWDWGDGNQSTWFGPYASGEIVNATYTWAQRGIYQVKVKAKDIQGAESNWSEHLQIKMYKLGDVNNDGWVTLADIDPFVAAIGTTEAQFQAQHPTWSWISADCNRDGRITFADIDPFVALLGTKNKQMIRVP